MIRLLNGRQIWVYKDPIDFRKQINGLVSIIIDAGTGSPNDGSIYVFQNRHKNKLKLLVWHINGFFLGYKRLEKGRFDFSIQENIIQISTGQLIQLVSGIPMIYVGMNAEKRTYFS